MTFGHAVPLPGIGGAYSFFRLQPQLYKPSDDLLPVSREESSKVGIGGILGRCAGGSGLSSARLFRTNRPRKPIATKAAPAIISQYGKLIDESSSTYFPFAFSPSSTGRLIVSASEYRSRSKRQ
jgi:hypothetical protein